MWLLIGSAFFFPCIVILMPTRLSRVHLYATTGFSIYFQLLTDFFLHEELNWYGYFKQVPRSEWTTLWYIPIYLSINPIFLNFYPYQSGRTGKTLYIIGWSLFSVGYKWCITKLGKFYHNQWKLFNSAIVYPFLFILLRMQLSLVRNLCRKDSLN